jgi:hypothetical protein
MEKASRPGGRCEYIERAVVDGLRTVTMGKAFINAARKL